MALSFSEADGDGEDSVALTLAQAMLALAVVAVTALALHWLGSGSEQDKDVVDQSPESSQTQRPQAGEMVQTPALKAKVSCQDPETEAPKVIPDPPVHPPVPSPREQQPGRSPEDSGSPRGTDEGLAPAAPPQARAPKITSRVAPQKQPGCGSQPSCGPQSKTEASPGTGPLLIHFTPRHPESWNEGVFGVREQPSLLLAVPAEEKLADEQGPVGQRHGLVVPSPRSRSRKPDPFALGTVVSVWDAIDSGSSVVPGGLLPQALGPRVSIPAETLTGTEEEWVLPPGSFQDPPPKRGGEGGRLSEGQSKPLALGPQPVPNAVQKGIGSQSAGREHSPRGTGPPASSASSPAVWTLAQGQAGALDTEEGWPWKERELLISSSFSRPPNALIRQLVASGQGSTLPIRKETTEAVPAPSQVSTDSSPEGTIPGQGPQVPGTSTGSIPRDPAKPGSRAKKGPGNNLLSTEGGARYAQAQVNSSSLCEGPGMSSFSSPGPSPRARRTLVSPASVTSPGAPLPLGSPSTAPMPTESPSSAPSPKVHSLMGAPSLETPPTGSQSLGPSSKAARPTELPSLVSFPKASAPIGSPSSTPASTDSPSSAPAPKGSLSLAPASKGSTSSAPIPKVSPSLAPEPKGSSSEPPVSQVSPSSASAPSGPPASASVPSGPPASASAPSGPPASASAPSGPPASASAPSGLPASASAPSGPPASASAPSGPPASASVPSGPPASASAPSGPPASASLPSGPPASASAPSGPPASASAPSGTPVSAATPSGPPASASAPSGPPASASAPSGPPASASAPSGPPASASVPSGPPASASAPSGPPASASAPSGPPASAPLSTVSLSSHLVTTGASPLAPLPTTPLSSGLVPPESLSTAGRPRAIEPTGSPPSSLSSIPSSPGPPSSFHIASTLPSLVSVFEASPSEPLPSVPIATASLPRDLPSVALALPVKSAQSPAKADGLTVSPGLGPASGGQSVSTLPQGPSGNWGNLISMVLRSHPFPGPEKPQGEVRQSTPAERLGPAAVASPSNQTGELTQEANTVASEPRAKVRDQSPSECLETPGTTTPNNSRNLNGVQVEEKRMDTINPPSGTQGPSPPPEPLGQPRPGPDRKQPEAVAPREAMPDGQPAPRPRKRSICQMVESLAQVVSPAGPSQREAPAGLVAPLTERQLQDSQLMAFLRRPGTWGTVEGQRKPSHPPKDLPGTVAAMRRHLDLGSCVEALAFAQQHGELALAEEVYTLMSDNFLLVLGDTPLYRQLGAGDRERILALRTTRGQAVLGVLLLPSAYGVSRSGLAGGSQIAEMPTPPLAVAGSRTYLHMFEPGRNTWLPLTLVPEEAPLRGCGLCTMHNYLFLAGGIRGSGPGAICTNEVFCYNPMTDIWTQVRPMLQARAQLKLVALEGLLYAIGGECLYSMECYDPRTDHWTSRAPLPAGTFPVAHEAVACRGDIYVTGGHLFYRLLKYSPMQDCWAECPYSASHRRSSDMVALGGFLYRFDLLRGVGAAVMRYNTVTGSWSQAAPLPLPEPIPLRCAVLGNTIYCLNQQVTATFTVAEGTAQFEARELKPFPMGGKGVLCPFTLTLPTLTPLQTPL